MKYIVSLLILIGSFNFSSAQDYSLIGRAEKKLNQKEYDKALRLLNRTENADYGFCGNAYFEAIFKIDSLKLRLFKEKNDLKELRKFLDNVKLEMPTDSTYAKERVLLALNYFSKEELKQSLINSVKLYGGKDLKEDLNKNFGFVRLKVTNDYDVKLPFNFYEIEHKATRESITFNEALLKLFEKSIYWEMLN